jgi:asparagine synthase (glutamine-hydrolysing)
MCGIVGIINKKSKKISKNLLSANNQMNKRGPDDEGYVLFDNDNMDICYGNDTDLTSFKDNQNYYPNENIENTFNKNYKVAFGHRRLSIVDLSSHGHQPMCDNDENYWITFNGEVYNYQEIREELIGLGCKFVSDTDTEVILKSYIQWKENCLEKFNGMFAFSIFDKKNDEVFIARDRIGIKPLYYTSQNNTFVFASDIKTLIKSGLYKPEVDWEGMYHNFSFSMTPRPNTSFKDVYALEQGHYIKLNINSLKFDKTKYWDIPTNVQNDNMSEKDAQNIVEKELIKSIKYRLISDVEVGSFMSGGVDSTLVSSIASKIQQNIKAFTLSFDKSISEYDELDEAKATAKMCNLTHVISTLEADVVLSNIDEMVLGYEEPFHHLAANFAISKIVKENKVKVVLNGIGGDELFAGYSIYKNINKWRMVSRFSALINIIPNGFNKKIDIIKKYAKAKSIDQFYSVSYSNFSDDEKSKLFKQRFNSLDEISKQYNKMDKEFTDDIEHISYLDIKSYIGNHHVHRTDQFTMHHSIEGRFPFLDHNLIEKAMTIPSKYKLKKGIGKYVLREVAKKYIAPECLSMKKKGFGLPLEYWFNNQLKDLTLTAIESLKNRNIFNNNEITRVMERGTVPQKWQLVMFELWYKKFIEEALVND